ncbi:PREDICTED: uncharacterized protein LOC109353983 [Lupinus angustifolius]|uniref:uncharacterized protein LOC109353983 n=1 Tax=Lupinus angustifolius TaxID=3871 RepID=UPI00092F1473|nr:PREDICTED: uncharacterized protein LOC109353983 [Lupinus angustifolius]
MRRQYELKQMNSGERVAEFFNRVINHTNVMKASGEKITNQTIVEKILRTLNLRFDHIVVAIEESKKMEELLTPQEEEDMEKMEVKGAETEEKIKEKGISRILNTLTKKCLSLIMENNHQEEENIRGGKGTRKGNLGKSQNETHLAKKESTESLDDEPILLMMTTDCEPSNDDKWYIDSGCSNHMTGNRNWLVNFDDSRKSNMRFADSRLIQAEETCDVLISRNVLIADVLYVPNMKSNLLSLGQLVEKGFLVHMHQGILEIFDAENKKILRVPLAQNRTFQVRVETGQALP